MRADLLDYDIKLKRISILASTASKGLFPEPHVEKSKKRDLDT